jgi:soluble lytic murein transglycosylase-like protein
MKYLIVALLFILGMFSSGNQAHAASAPQARVQSHAVSKVQKQVVKNTRKAVQKRKRYARPVTKPQIKKIAARPVTPQVSVPAGKQQYTGPLSPEQDAAVSWVMAETRNQIDRNHARYIVKSAYETAEQKGIDPKEVLSIMRVESRFIHTAASSHGAKGLMQVMAHIHRDKLAGRSPFSVDASIDVGTTVYADCLKRNGGSAYRALNCYSGGGGSGYANKIAHARRSLDKTMVFELFVSDQPRPVQETT